MIEQIYNDYGLLLEPVTFNGGQWLSSGDQIFCFIDQTYFHHPDVREVSIWCTQFIHQGYNRIAWVVPKKDGTFETDYNRRNFVLLAFPKKQNSVPPDSTTLAEFHRSGREALKLSNSRNGLFPNWRDFWAKRIDDLSVHWNEVEQKEERNDYEECFLRVFPYFSGRAENAIQYITDLLIDWPITDEITICHHRFNANSWGSHALFANTPDQWVVDHPARDLAEWLRGEIAEGVRPVSEMNDFVDTYQEKNELSTAGMGLVFARILFPIGFIENVEYVFDHSGDSSQALSNLNHMLTQLYEEERFLASFGKRYMRTLPRIDWLAHKLKVK